MQLLVESHNGTARSTLLAGCGVYLFVALKSIFPLSTVGCAMIIIA